MSPASQAPLTHALDELAQHDHVAYQALVSVPAAWTTDAHGVAHGKAAHTRCGVRSGGTLGQALEQPRCPDPDCLTPGRIAAGPGYTAERDARLLLFAHQYVQAITEAPDHDTEIVWERIKDRYDELTYRNLAAPASATHAAAQANLAVAHAHYVARLPHHEPRWRRTAIDWLLRHSTTGPIGDLRTLLPAFDWPQPDPHHTLSDQLHTLGQQHLNKPPAMHTIGALDVLPPDQLAALLAHHGTAEAVTRAWRNHVELLLDHIDPWIDTETARLAADTRLTLLADPGTNPRIPPLFDAYRDTPHGNILRAPYIIGAYLAARYHRAHVHLDPATPQGEIDIVHTLLEDRCDSADGDQTELLTIARRLNV